MYDAGNLAAFLYGLKNLDDTGVYRRLVGTIQLIAPFFEDFDLEPTGPGGKEIFLNWREKGSDQLFGPHQLSDGTLRAICLVTLLLQPVDTLPTLIIVDEPELGLHPYALNIIADLFQSASSRTQVLVSTQSSTFLDNFDPEDVIVVDRNADGTDFCQHSPAAHFAAHGVFLHPAVQVAHARTKGEHIAVAAEDTNPCGMISRGLQNRRRGRTSDLLHSSTFMPLPRIFQDWPGRSG
jgi:hypothetical protein